MHSLMFTWLDVMLSEEVVKGLCNGIGSHLSPSAAHRPSTVPGVWLKRRQLWKETAMLARF